MAGLMAERERAIAPADSLFSIVKSARDRNGGKRRGISGNVTFRDIAVIRKARIVRALASKSDQTARKATQTRLKRTSDEDGELIINFQISRFGAFFPGALDAA
jgi:hypothetical protein